MLRSTLRLRIAHLLLALAAIAPFFGLGARDLWNPDEADHATAAREMLVAGDWVQPTIAGETYAEKPPLQAWIIILSAKARGTDVDAFDARLPSAIGNLLLVLGAFALGRRVGGGGTGVLAALVACSTSEAFLRMRWCQVDGLFTGLFALTAFATLQCLERPSVRATLGLGLALGLAVLTKGPLAVALLVALVATDALLEPAHRRAWLGAAGASLAGALLLAAAVALPWYLALASRDPQGLWRTLVFENLQRFARSQDHQRPFPYYVAGALWSSFAPSSLLLPPALLFAWRTSSRSRRDAVRGRDAGRLRFCIAGLLGGILLLSVASSKQGKYLLPLAPFFGVIVADFAKRSREHALRWERAWTTAILSVIALAVVVGALIALAASFFGPMADRALLSVFAAFGEPPEETIPVGDVLPAALVAGFACLALLAAGSQSRASLRLGWLCTGILGAGILASVQLLPAIDPLKSARPVVEEAMDRIDELERSGASPRYAVWMVDRPADRPVPSWTDSAPFVFFARGKARRPLVLHGSDALRAALAEDRGPLVLVLREGHFRVMPSDLRRHFSVRFRKQVGSRTLVGVESGA